MVLCSILPEHKSPQLPKIDLVLNWGHGEWRERKEERERETIRLSERERKKDLLSLNVSLRSNKKYQWHIRQNKAETR